jgi:hypothetical protein
VSLGIFPKFAAIYCGPFEVLEKIDPVAYIIPLLASMIIHNMFHVSLLEKYVPDPNHVIYWTVIEVEHEGEFWVELTHILYWKFKVLNNKSIELVKVQMT